MLDLLLSIDAVIFFIILFVLGMVFFSNSGRPSGCPPGPRTIPFIGNMHLLTGDKRVAFGKLRERYGNLFSVFTGGKLIIVVNGYKAVKDVFATNSKYSIGRHPGFFYDQVTRGGKGLFWSVGETWDENRTFAIRSLGHLLKDSDVMLSCIQEELRYFVDELKSTKGVASDHRCLISSAMTNISYNVLIGKRFDYKDSEFLKIVSIVERSTTSSQLVLNMLPFLRFLPCDSLEFFSELKKQNKVLDQFSNELEEHRKTFDGSKIRDAMDYYLMDKAKGQSTISEEELPFAFRDLLLPGGNTPSCTIAWSMLILLNHPTVVRKLKEEAIRVVGEDRLPTPQDKTSMPYTAATCLEIHRFACTTPFSVPHKATADFTVEGYTIPDGAILIPNLHSVFNDKDTWGDPEVFRPERFLDENGRASGREELIPYFTGPRKCVGASMADDIIFLFLTTIVQQFDILPEEKDSAPPIKGTVYKTYEPNNYKMRFIARKDNQTQMANGCS